MNRKFMSFVERIGRIGVFFGGRSRERSISLRSGRAIYGALKKAGFRVAKIDTVNGFHRTLKSKKIDFGFPALHGAGGEDGAIQKILARHRIPYVGSDSRSSLLAFDKLKAKRLFKRCQIPTPRYQRVTRKNFKNALARWYPPYVLKPVREGSSIDVVMVERGRPARDLMRRLFEKYPELLIEEKIKGREFTVAVLGDRALPVIEIRPKRSFYDFKAKYTKGFTDYLVPAPISKELSVRLQEIAVQVHTRLGLNDLSRVDFMVDEAENAYVLEVNSIPGFTETSLLPKAAAHVGLDFTGLCTRLLELAYARQVLKTGETKWSGVVLRGTHCGVF